MWLHGEEWTRQGEMTPDRLVCIISVGSGAQGLLLVVGYVPWGDGAGGWWLGCVSLTGGGG